MIERLRRISYFCAYAVATIPLWHYIRDGRILAGMIAIVLFAYVMVVFSSVKAAQPILSSEKAKISLPRWLPDRPKYQKWWMIVRRTLKWHLLLVPSKMGLALGFVEFLHSSSMISTHLVLLRPYIYWNAPVNFLHPQPETMVIGIIVITLFAIANCCLLCSIVLYTDAKFLKTIRKILVLFFVCIGIADVITPPIVWHLNPCRKRPCNSITPQVYTLIPETIFTIANTTIGQGVLLSSNIMRPRHLQRDQLWDNRPFVARQIVAGLLGLMLYAGTTWVILWFVEDERELL